MDIEARTAGATAEQRLCVHHSSSISMIIYSGRFCIVPGGTNGSN